MAVTPFERRELANRLRNIRTHHRAALARVENTNSPSRFVYMRFIDCYYVCFRALYAHRPVKHMPKPALLRYMRYCKLAVAENVALARENFPPDRLKRLQQARWSAWQAYEATDRG